MCDQNDDWEDVVADYSPDGREVLYLHRDTCADGATRSGLWTVGVHGSTARQIATFPIPFGDRLAAMSLPDGGHAAVLSTKASGDPPVTEQVLTVFNIADGSVAARTLMPLALPGDGADWIANGRLAHVRTHGRDELQRIFLAQPAPGTVRRITGPAPGEGGASFRWSWDGHPDASPSGRTIAFVRTTQRGADDSTASTRARASQTSYRHNIWRVPAAGPPDAARRLTNLRYAEPPVFSPDGQTIAFKRPISFPGPKGIYALPSRGGRVRLLVRIQRRFESAIAWRPLPHRALK